MSDNLDFGPEADANHALAVLRAAQGSSAVISGKALSPGIWFDLDPEGETTGHFETSPGEIVTASFNVARPGRWMALHVDLGSADLSGRQIVGLLCKSRAPEPVLARVCLRSGTPEGFSDIFFPKRLVAFDQPSLHVDMLRLEESPAPPAHAAWRQLILFLDTRSLEISILDMRLFCL